MKGLEYFMNAKQATCIVFVRVEYDWNSLSYSPTWFHKKITITPHFCLLTIRLTSHELYVTPTIPKLYTGNKEQ